MQTNNLQTYTEVDSPEEEFNGLLNNIMEVDGPEEELNGLLNNINLEGVFIPTLGKKTN